MLAVNRHRKILELLQAEGTVKVSELSQLLQVTEKTVREDLEKLERKQLLKRIHGGAVPPLAGEQPAFTLQVPNTINQAEKEKIALFAVEHFIEPHDIIALDGGSTTLEMAKRLKGMPLTVVTNDLLIIRELAVSEDTRLVVPGGFSHNNLLIQHDPMEWVKELNIHKLFLSTTGIHLEYGLSIFSGEQIPMKKTLMDGAKEIICVADHSKFGRGALHTFGSIQDIDCFITDAGLSEEVRQSFLAEQVRIEIAE
ncbi:DeoR/GlpR family DNA-binding transcription regulator [Marinicrinis lubricantis]|uniref:DeoR/GlpR family DNA-binding transcription regulator n=1 Tax=Marinicrinis lubricantis TaxID=2086470 RepID=A0ABW1IL57_9BACL